MVLPGLQEWNRAIPGVIQPKDVLPKAVLLGSSWGLTLFFGEHPQVVDSCELQSQLL